MKYICDTCKMELWNPIAEFPGCYLGLYNDSRYPGRCILMLKHHAEHLTDLGDDLLFLFSKTMKRTGEILLKATGASRINYAILGNAEPHIHAHLIPRYGTDPLPNKSPWNHPEPVTKMTEGKYKETMDNIAKAVQESPYHTVNYRKIK